MGIEYETRTITPDMAKTMLEHNIGNRSPKPRAIARYAEDMRNGHWMETGDPIRFASDGRLIDGQNRLMACIEADMPFTTLVAHGLESRTQMVMDQGVRRTGTDVVHFAAPGLKDATVVASIVRADRAWKTVGPDAAFAGGSRHYTPSASDLADWLESHPECASAAETAKTVNQRTRNLLPKSVIGVLWLRFREKDMEDADRFMDLFASGAGLAADDPILVLRDRLRVAKERKEPMVARAALMVKAWDKWRQGGRVSRLNWSPAGGRAFPAVE